VVNSRAFPKFPPIPRWYKDWIITEKIDGTNGLICVIDTSDYTIEQVHEPLAEIDGLRVYAGSRNRWLEAEKGKDNYGFAAWVKEHAEDAVALGVGLHYGEWYGQGIQRNYGLSEKRFALFNTSRWTESRPESFDVVPVLWQGEGYVISNAIDDVLWQLEEEGSVMVPGFYNPEGIVIYNIETGKYWKQTIHADKVPKSEQR